MKKHILLSVLTVLLFGCGKDTESGDDNLPKYLYEVQMKESTIHSITGNFINPILKEVDRFDEAGKLIYTNRRWLGIIDNKWYDDEDYYTYDSNGLIIKISNRYDVSQYEYNEGKQLVRKTHHKGVLLKTIITYTYDNALLVREDEDNVDLGSQHYTLYEYNGLKVSKSETYNKSDYMIAGYLFEYDDHGNSTIIKWIVGETSRPVSQYYAYTYNSDGSINTLTDFGSKTSIHSDGVDKISYYQYDADGRLVQIETNKVSSGNPISKKVYTHIYKPIGKR